MKFHICTTLFRLALLLAVFSKTKGVVKLPSNASLLAVFFGDSLMDTGNNNNMQIPAKYNFPPCGKDFQGGIPTGRFNNGKEYWRTDE